MLIGEVLAQRVLSAISGMNVYVTPSIYLNVIYSYVMESTEVIGTYTGVVTPPPPATPFPDPNNGPCSLKVVLPLSFVTGAAYLAFLTSLKESADPNGFIKAIMAGTVGTTLVGVAPITMTTTGIYNNVPYSAGELKALSELRTHESAILTICNKLVENFKSLVVAQPVPATSVAGGIGAASGFVVR